MAENTSKTILVVDDEEGFLEMLRLVLSLRGYRVLTARDGNEALDRIAAQRPDLIILDIGMPRMGGTALYNRISMPNGQPMYPTIVCTAQEDYRALFTDLGVQGFVTKPFDMEAFLKLVEEVVTHHVPLDLAQPHPETPRDKELQKRVMIVEDDPLVRHRLAALFLDGGYSVTTALTSEQAIETFFLWIPTMILIKQGIPGFPEFILGNHVRQMPHMRSIDIIVYSGEYGKIDVLTEEKLVSLFDSRHIAAFNDPEMLFERAQFILTKHKA